jgi:phenylacetyl-CoA:acceptor oxidoreductase subunit 2
MSETMSSRRQKYWDVRAAGNFIGGGTGSGLIVAAAAAAALGAPFRVVLLLGLTFIAAGLTLVWLEIGRPWRALHVFFHPRTSWMAREGIVAGALFALGAVAAAGSSATFAALAAALAVGFLYCQARILRAARGIAAWRQQEIVALILAAGLAEGCACALIIGPRGGVWLGLALAAGLAREVAWRFYRAGLARAPGAARSLAVFAAAPARRLGALHRVGLGLIAAALVLRLVFAPTAGPLAPNADPNVIASGLAIAGGALVAASGWGMKLLLITRAAFTSGFSLPVMPIRGAEKTHAH